LFWVMDARSRDYFFSLIVSQKKSTSFKIGENSVKKTEK